ncbi:MAG: HEPN domain-containing protein [Chitinispirillales bacterium]|jgi:HEPN domain-containing protein|nr:HEPN domain-containing protein [Chitinispirillales bacterium]
MTDSLDVNKWIHRAYRDYEDALTLAKHFRPSIENICYLCQQSAEKILKAYKIAKTGVSIKTHDFDTLIDSCIPYSADFDSLRNICANISPYITAARYPVDIDITDYDMKRAIKDAGEILEFTKVKLKEMGYEYNPED